MKPIYLDYNASTPVHPEIISNLPLWSKNWGNPSSTHSFGRKAKEVLREARKNWATALGVSPLELIWTSGGSEANHLAIYGCLRALQKSDSSKKCVLLGPMEHPSVSGTTEQIKDWGYNVITLRMKPGGGFDFDFYESLLKSEDVALVSLMHANNETGLLFPIEQASEMAAKHGSLFHCDGVQGLGKISLNLNKANHIHFFSLSAHKFYSLKGCGLLYIKSGTPFDTPFLGGGQERKRRPGTENTLAIQAFGHMTTLLPQVEEKAKKLKALQTFFESTLKIKVPSLKIVSENKPRLYNTTCVLLPEPYEAIILFMNLDMEGFCVSTGSACSSGKTLPSSSLMALGYSSTEVTRCLRISYGWFTEKKDLQLLADSLERTLNRLSNPSSNFQSNFTKKTKNLPINKEPKS